MDKIKAFKGLLIPYDVYFRDLSIRSRFLAGDLDVTCNTLTNCVVESDPWGGVRSINSSCRGISCCNCIFFKGNFKERAEYFEKCLNADEIKADERDDSYMTVFELKNMLNSLHPATEIIWKVQEPVNTKGNLFAKVEKVPEDCWKVIINLKGEGDN